MDGAILLWAIYVLCGLLIIPLLVAYLWTGIRAFRAIRRQLDAARDSVRLRRAA